MEARINAEATVAEKANLWTATSLLLGMKYEKDFIQQLLEGTMFDLRDSSVYRAAIDEGRAEGLTEGRAEGRAEGEQKGERSLILRQGSKRFGEPTLQIQATLEAVTSVERLEELGVRLLEVESWDELLEQQ